MATALTKRIRGWMMFDWAQQPIFTLGLTFIFGPYFAGVAQNYFETGGADPETAKAHAQSLWSAGQTVSGLFIAISAPILGAWAERTGRKMNWIAGFSIVYFLCAWSLWGLMPEGQGIYIALILFNVGIVAAEYGLNFTNSILPSLGNDREIGAISGKAMAVGYWGGVVSLIIMLTLFEDSVGKTYIGIDPILGLDPEKREGTRAVGPVIAIWYAVFMIPFFLWVKDDQIVTKTSAKLREAIADLWGSVKLVRKSDSLTSFLVGSMFYRDGLNALYAFGGVYATFVLGWETMQIGIFGIVAAITAAVFTWIGGLSDRAFGPKPVISVTILILSGVCLTLILMTREQIGPIALAEGSNLPDILMYICGAVIGGAGGTLQASSRSMMVRHINPARPTEGFGLYALSGRATAFLAPMLITGATLWTGNTRLGLTPIILLFLLGLLMLRWVKPEGDRSAWVAQA